MYDTAALMEQVKRALNGLAPKHLVWAVTEAITGVRAKTATLQDEIIRTERFPDHALTTGDRRTAEERIRMKQESLCAYCSVLQLLVPLQALLQLYSVEQATVDIEAFFRRRA